MAVDAGVRETPHVQLPEVSYARCGDVAIAYQVVGEGRPDIVFVRAMTRDLLSTWEQPLLVRHVQGLAACGRVLMLDKRGTGLSDRVREVPSVETAMDNVRAVMDSAGSKSAVLWTGGPRHWCRCALRGDVSRSLYRPCLLRSKGERHALRQLPLGPDRGGMA